MYIFFSDNMFNITAQINVKSVIHRNNNTFLIKILNKHFNNTFKTIIDNNDAYHLVRVFSIVHIYSLLLAYMKPQTQSACSQLVFIPSNFIPLRR